MAKDVLITPASGIIEFKDTSVLKGSVYESNGDLYIDPASGVIVLGDGTATDIQIGATGVPVQVSLLGGGDITSNGSTLNVGLSGDTINLNVAGVTYNFPSTLLRTSDYTAADVLAKIKTVDGSGSGLDADTLDGLNPTSANTASTIVSRDSSGNFSAGTITATLNGSASYAQNPTFVNDSTSRNDITTRVETGFYQTDTGTKAEGWPTDSAAWHHLISTTHSNDSNYYAMQIAARFDTQEWYFRNTADVGTRAWSKVWHDNNDGAGSGLDADTLDGNHASAFYLATNPSGYTSNTGTVTSVSMTVPTGLSISGSPITASGTLALSLETGYSIPTTTSQSNWDTAYTDRNKWDGGSTGLVASTGRTSLGATTIGSNLFTLTNPSAITFPRFNADDTVSALDAASFRTAIGAGTSSTTGTVTSVGGTGSVSGISLSGTVTTSGDLTLSGALSVTPSNFASQTANTFLAAPNGSDGTPSFRAIVAADIPTLNQNTTGSAASLSGTATSSINSSALGSGTADSTTYLRGDRTWATVAAGSNITVSNDNTTNATRYIVWEDVTSGSSTSIGVSSTKLYFNPSTGTLNATVFNSLSDENQKTNIRKIINASDVINKIEGVEFDWIDNHKKSSGVIAQQLEEVLPHLVSESNGIKSVNYSGLIAYLIESNKELQKRIEILENK